MSRVAIVGAEPILALDMAECLGAAGYEAGGIWGAPENLREAIAGGIPAPDLTILDAGYGRESRKTVLKNVVLIVSHPAEKTDSLTGASDALGFLEKPFGRPELLRTVEFALYRAEMERNLRRSEHRYRELFEKSTAARFVCTSDGRLADRNEAFTVLCGRHTDSLREIIPRPDWEAIVEAMAGRGSFGPRELSLDAGGPDAKVPREAIRAIVSIASMGTPGAEAVWQGEMVDQTEASALRDTVARSQRMEAMGRLAGSVAHDFNNVLTAIMGHATLMKYDLDHESPALADLEGILDASERASAITRQLLSLARKRTFSPRPIDLGAAIRESGKMLGRLAGEAAALGIGCPEPSPWILADPSQIDQVLINLVVNARDAMAGRVGSRVEIRVSVVSLDKPRRVGGRSLAAGRYALLEVADNGPGMSPEVAGRVFDPFFTTKDEGFGSGMGLAIVDGIAQASGGAVELETGLDRGARFTVWFPEIDSPGGSRNMVRTPDGDGAFEAPDGRRESLRGLRVLVVDDDEIVLPTLARMLSLAGCGVTPARNAGEAIVAAERARYDLLVTDVDMPFMNGVDLAERLRAEGKACATLFITGRSMDAAHGAEPCLEKPFASADFMDAAEKAVLEFRRGDTR